MGIPSITTNLSGFGCFMQDRFEQPEDEGCYIIDRRRNSYEESVDQLADYLERFCNKTMTQHTDQSDHVERLSALLDWTNLGIEYAKSRQLALRRAYPDACHVTDEECDEDVDYFMVSKPNVSGCSPHLK